MAQRARQLRIRALALVAIVAATICGAALARTSLRQVLARRATWPREADALYLPSAKILEVLSLGHHEMAADLVAARANVYFGTQLASRGDHRWLGRYFQTAIDLDPWFHSLYLRGAAMLVYTGKTFTVEALEAANALLERGARQFPLDWELPFQLGFNLLYELPRLAGPDDARVVEWRQRGVEALRQATLLDGGPAWLPGLAARVLTKEGGEELAVRHLEQAYAASNSAETRAQISRRLSVLKGRRRAAEMAEGAAALERIVSERYPYAPEAFNIIAGPRFAPGIDLRLPPTSP
jgi:hypothetical protein